MKFGHLLLLLLLLTYPLSAQTPEQMERHRRFSERFPEADTNNDKVPVHMSHSRPNTPVTEKTSLIEWIHHALLGLKLQEAMHKSDLECIVVHPELKDDTYRDLPDFLIKKLTAKPTVK